jgi:hypothetical protein
MIETIDLTTARTRGAAYSFMVPGPELRVQSIGAPITLRVRGEDVPITEAQPVIARDCQPLGEVQITHDAAPGKSVVIFYSQALSLGKADGAAVDLWRAHAVLVPGTTAAPLVNLLDPNAGTSGDQRGANVGTGLSITGTRTSFVLAADATAGNWNFARYNRERYNIAGLALPLFAPGYTPTLSAQTRSRLTVGVRCEATAYITSQLSGAGLGIGFLGWFHFVSATNRWYPFGVGFAWRATAADAGTWYAAVLGSEGSMGDGTLWPVAADRLVWVNLGVSVAAWHTLRCEIAQAAGTPYIAWSIDGVIKHLHVGPWPSYPTWPAANPICEGAGICRSLGNSADLAQMRLTGPIVYETMKGA